MLKNLRLRSKLRLIIGISLIAMVTISYVAISNMNKLTADKSDMYNTTKLILNTDRDMYQALVAAQNLLLYDKDSSEYRKWINLFKENVGQVKEMVTETKILVKDFKEQLQNYQEDENIDYDGLIDKFFHELERWEFNTLALVENNEPNLNLIFIKQNRINANFDLARDQLNLISDLINNFSNDRIAQDKKLEEAAASSIIITVITAFFIVFILGMLFIKNITSSIGRVAKIMDFVSRGDLTVNKINVVSKDEIGQLGEAVNIMVDNIKALAKDSADIARQVAASSEKLTISSNEMKNGIEQVSATTEELASGVSTQAENSVETMDIYKEVDQEIKQINESAQTLSNISGKVEEASKSGLENIKQSIEQMKMIEGKVSSTVNIIQGLTHKSNEINQILEVITKIAEQTNLLALNAAIEAARAGEHGRSFAVVADEVRKLAEESEKSTKQIADIIQSVKLEAEQSGKAMGEVVQEVRIGSEVIDINGKSFNDIINTINEMSKKIAEVTNATHQINKNSSRAVEFAENIAGISEEASAGAEELAAAMEQQNASMQEITSMANNLAAWADKLNISIGKFKY